MTMFSKLNLEYFNLAKEFRNFVLGYNFSRDHITESVLNNIIKRLIEYILTLTVKQTVIVKMTMI